MALVLKNIFTPSTDEIAQNYVIESWHVSQSVDALTGVAAYDITISGSLNLTGSTLTGSTANITSITGSLLGTATTASVAQQVKITNNATTNQSFRLLFVSQTGLPDPNNDGYAQPRFDSGSDGSGLYYNPLTNTLNVGRISGSNDGSAVDFVGTSSYALTASVATNAATAQSATNYFPSYVGIDSLTYTASTNPYTVAGITPPVVYVSQSSDILGLNFFPNAATDGQTVTFVSNYRNISALQTSNIEISASGINIYGKGGIASVIPSSGNGTLFSLLGSSIPTVDSVTFQFITTTSTLFPTVGWYVMNYN